MKRKILFSMMVMLIIVLTFISSCSKEYIAEQTVSKAKTNSIATLIENHNKVLPNSTENLIFGLQTQIGHPSSGCGGCVTFNGVKYHIDCQGYGNICDAYVSINMPSSPKPYNDVSNFISSTQPPIDAVAVYEDELTIDSTFFFPERSFLVAIDELKDEELWLNIPEQILIRNANNLFVFKNVFYSSRQIFSNL